MNHFRKNDTVSCPDGDIYKVLKQQDPNSMCWEDGANFYRIRNIETLEEYIIREYDLNHTFQRVED